MEQREKEKVLRFPKFGPKTSAAQNPHYTRIKKLSILAACAHCRSWQLAEQFRELSENRIVAQIFKKEKLKFGFNAIDGKPNGD